MHLLRSVREDLYNPLSFDPLESNNVRESVYCSIWVSVFD